MQVAAARSDAPGDMDASQGGRPQLQQRLPRLRRRQQLAVQGHQHGVWDAALLPLQGPGEWPPTLYCLLQATSHRPCQCHRPSDSTKRRSNYPTFDGHITPTPSWFAFASRRHIYHTKPCAPICHLQDPSFSSSMRSGCVATNKAKSTTCYTYADGGPKSSGGELVLHAYKFHCACVADTSRAGYTGCAKCVKTISCLMTIADAMQECLWCAVTCPRCFGCT
jgi:hypothetical protein